MALKDCRIAGYLAGSCDDPAREPLFADIGYFEELAEATVLYPAHLHINVHEAFRSTGTGSRLIARFVADLKRAGIPGVHLVTSPNSRNVQFYLRNGFAPVRHFTHAERELLMLGRRVDGV